MRFIWNISAFIVCLGACLSEIVEIDDGKIEGTLLKSRLGLTFQAFFRIPYAEPPLQNLRFRAPRPVKKWKGILDGTKPGAVCFQRRSDTRMSEDCLQLNVFTKNLTGNNPTIVFIHGGGFEVGSALDQGIFLLFQSERKLICSNF
jgi:carboxylesterase type B